jgi:hypothetical protein
MMQTRSVYDLLNFGHPAVITCNAYAIDVEKNKDRARRVALGGFMEPPSTRATAAAAAAAASPPRRGPDLDASPSAMPVPLLGSAAAAAAAGAHGPSLGAATSIGSVGVSESVSPASPPPSRLRMPRFATADAISTVPWPDPPCHLHDHDRTRIPKPHTYMHKHTCTDMHERTCTDMCATRLTMPGHWGVVRAHR